MNRLFKLSGATHRDPKVDAWLNAAPDELHAVANRWFAQMRACGDDVRELIHDGCPTACVEDAPFANVNVFKAHVNVGFYNGAALDDPAGLLAGGGKRMRHVKLLPYTEPNSALTTLITAAYLNIKVELDAARLAR